MAPYVNHFFKSFQVGHWPSESLRELYVSVDMNSVIIIFFILKKKLIFVFEIQLDWTKISSHLALIKSCAILVKNLNVIFVPFRIYECCMVNNLWVKSIHLLTQTSQCIIEMKSFWQFIRKQYINDSCIFWPAFGCCQLQTLAEPSFSVLHVFSMFWCKTKEKWNKKLTIWRKWECNSQAKSDILQT